MKATVTTQVETYFILFSCFNHATRQDILKLVHETTTKTSKVNAPQRRQGLTFTAAEIDKYPGEELSGDGGAGAPLVVVVVVVVLALTASVPLIPSEYAAVPSGLNNP